MPSQSVRQYLVPAVTVLSLGLTGCLDTGSEASGGNGAGNGSVAGDAVSGGDAPLSRTTSVHFDPTNQVIPFPNNLLFEAADDAELDGTLNAPIDENDPDSAALIKGLNDLNGFSTIAAWRLEFTNEVDDSSLVAGETVRVFKLETAGNTYPERTQGVGVEKELKGGEDFELRYLNGGGEGPYRIKIIPTRALEHDATYAAIITDGVRDTDGNRVASPIEWSVARGEGRLDECGDENIADEAFLQCITNRAIAPVADADNGLSRGDMIMGWGVTTQREDAAFWHTADSLIRDLEEKGNPTQLEFFDVGSAPGEDAPRTPGGNAIVWPGTIKLPYGLKQPENLNAGGDPTPADLSSHWACSGGQSCNSDRALSKGLTPDFTDQQTAPAILAMPDPDNGGAPMPEEGYPVVIFQHAIQQDRSTGLAIADELAANGYAVVAIDMPLHGIVLEDLGNSETDQARAQLHATELNAAMEEAVENGLTRDDRLPEMIERTLYVDNQDAEGNEGSDGRVDSSGSHFLVPNQPLNQRDLMRQAALDLTMLSHYLRANLFEPVCVEVVIDPLNWFSGCDESDLPSSLNTDEIHFLGHSVGNIVASPFLTYDQEIRSVSMMAPTGGIMRTLEGSETIGPQLSEGLADAGLQPGQEDYYRFFNVVQSVLNSVEPLNHAPAIGQGADGDRPVYMAQIVGNDGSDGTATPSDADLVLPPTVDGWPTAGSTPLADAMGLSHDPAGQSGDGITVGDGQTPLQTRVSFRYGDHASFLLPLNKADEPAGNVAGFPYEGEDYDSSLDPYDEMQHQVGSFLGNQGQQLEINEADKVDIQ